MASAVPFEIEPMTTRPARERHKDCNLHGICQIVCGRARLQSCVNGAQRSRPAGRHGPCHLRRKDGNLHGTCQIVCGRARLQSCRTSHLHNLSFRTALAVRNLLFPFVPPTPSPEERQLKPKLETTPRIACPERSPSCEATRASRTGAHRNRNLCRSVPGQARGPSRFAGAKREVAIPGPSFVQRTRKYVPPPRVRGA